MIHVDPQHDRLAGFDWPAGGSVTVQIDEDADPGNGMLGEWAGLLVQEMAVSGSMCLMMPGSIWRRVISFG